MKFLYKASTQNGEILEGQMEASTHKEALEELQLKNLLILNLKPDKSRFLLNKWNLNFGGGIEKVMLTKNLAVMLKSGLSLVESLEVLSEQSEGKMKGVIEVIKKKVNEGQTLAQAMSFFPKIFSPIFTNLIKSGEAAGTLEENLNYLSVQEEKEQDLKRKITSAMIYPALVVSTSIVLVIILTVFVLPKVTRLFTQLKLDLPLSTKILIWVSDVVQKYGIVIAAAIVIIIGAAIYLLRLKRIKPWSHKLLLSIPLIKKMVKEVNLARISRTLGTLLQSGLSITEALEITQDTLINYHFKNSLKSAVNKVRKGKNLSDSLAEFPKIYPKMLTKMVGVGEHSGDLEGVLLYLAQYYEQEVDNTTKRLSVVLEPIMLIIIGLLVGFIAISIITPIYKISGGFRV